jgi:translation initiation factor IF-2
MADRPNRPNRPIRPRQGATGGRRKRRVVIDTGAARPRQDGRQARERTDVKPKEKTPVAPLTGPVTVESGVTVKDLSQAVGVPVPKLITILMGLGAPKTVTQSLSDEEVELIAAEVGREVNIKHAAE